MHIEQINALFETLRGAPVILYGLGEMTKLMLNNKHALIFSVVGVMDQHTTSGNFMGVPIISSEQVPGKASTIVITASMAFCSIIYSRIKHLEKEHVTIFAPTGKNLTEQPAETAHALAYFAKQQEEVKRLIDTHDVVSFDIFDTLLMRTCMLPDGVFHYMEQKYDLWGFTDNRKSLPLAYKKHHPLPHPTIAALYAFGLQSGLFSTDYAKEELEAEYLLCAPRHDIAALFAYALRQGKRIILVSDMYWSAKHLSDLLKANGIEGFHHIFVSCEMGKGKTDGTLWTDIQSRFPTQSIVHIGDNHAGDYLTPSQAGITAYLVDGPMDLARYLGFAQVLAVCESVADYIYTGLSFIHVLNLIVHRSDSAQEKKYLVLSSAKDIGYAFMGPQTTAFVFWLLHTAQEHKEPAVMFFARDGYLWVKLYNQLREMLPQYHTAPLGHYFYVSRRALCGASATSTSHLERCMDIYYLARTHLTVHEWFALFFGFSLPHDEFTAQTTSQVSAQELIEYIHRVCAADVFTNALQERECFLRYTQKMLADNTNRPAFVDFLTSQKTPFLLQELLGFPITLYCYGARADNADEQYKPHRTHAFLDTTFSMLAPMYNAAEHFPLCETVYSSPENTLMRFTTEGDPLFCDEAAKDFTIIEQIHHGIQDFCNDVAHIGIGSCSSRVADALLGVLFSGNYTVSQEISSTMIWSERIANRSMPIFSGASQ